jgi:tetratricopeptide (TPR) repeat protein
MEPMQTNQTDEADRGQPPAWETGTISAALDRLDSLIGRIGMNSSVQSRAILTELDDISARIRNLGSHTSQKPLQVQFDALLARLHTDAGSFLRDLGGRSVLQELRAAQRPPEENHWWYLDDWLTQHRKANWRSSMRRLGAVALGLALLTVIYQVFFAPDPAFIARLEHKQNAEEAILSGDFETAQEQIEQGLTYDHQDLELLTLKGVVLQSSGKLQEAQTVFDQAALAAASRHEFLLTRGQAYILAARLDAALADTQTVLAENPQSALAHLLAGQIYELMQDYFRALDNYDQAAILAEAQNQLELIAIARTRMAFLTQIISAPQWPEITETP